MRRSDRTNNQSGRNESRLGLVVVSAVWVLSVPILLMWWERPIVGPSDGVAHVVLFAALTMSGLGVAADRWQMPVALVAVVGGALFLAVGTEAAQAQIVSDRSGSLNDIVLNFLGIALGLVAFWAVRALAGQRWRVALASVSAATFASTAIVGASMTIRESTWWRCRDVEPATLELSQLNVSPGPELELDGVRGVWRWSAGETPITEPAPQAAAGAAWCAAIESNEFTIVVEIGPEVVSDGADILLLATPREEGNSAFNFELGLESGSISFRYRSGRSDRFPHYRVHDVLPSRGTVLFALRRANNTLSVFVDGDEVRSPQALFPLSSWNQRAKLIAGPVGRRAADSGLRYIAFFGRGLTDDELRL